jgi:hypothetical protein
MKRIFGLTVGTVAVALAVGCSGSNAGSSGTGGASTGGGTSTGGGVPTGGSSSSSGGGMPTGSTSAGGAFSTNVPASTSLSSLSPAQLTELCSELSNYLNNGAFTKSASDYECKVLAVVAGAAAKTDAEAQAACTASYGACKPDAGPAPATGQCTAPPATCTATVGDLKACLNAYSTTFATLDASVPTCDKLTVAQAQSSLAALAGDGGTGLTTPAACVSYQAKCPDSSMAPPPMGM